MAVRCDNERAVGLEPRVPDVVSGAGRLGNALLIQGLQVETAAQNLVIELHRFAGAALKLT